MRWTWVFLFFVVHAAMAQDCENQLISEDLGITERVSMASFLPRSEAEFSALFQSVKLNALSSIDWQKADRIIDDLAHGNLGVLNKENQALLKSARKASSNIRSAYSFFGKKKNTYPPFLNFVREFGVLNDSIAYKVSYPLIPGKARALEKIMAEEPMKSENLSLTPLSFEDFHDRILGLQTKMSDLLAKPGLTLDEYHDLRQRVRDFKVLFDFIERSHPDATLKSEVKTLDAISTKMGENKDRWTITDPFRVPGLMKKDRYKVSPDLRTKIERFLNEMSAF